MNLIKNAWNKTKEFVKEHPYVASTIAGTGVLLGGIVLKKTIFKSTPKTDIGIKDIPESRFITEPLKEIELTDLTAWSDGCKNAIINNITIDRLGETGLFLKDKAGFDENRVLSMSINETYINVEKS